MMMNKGRGGRWYWRCGPLTCFLTAGELCTSSEPAEPLAGEKLAGRLRLDASLLPLFCNNLAQMGRSGSGPRTLLGVKSSSDCENISRGRLRTTTGTSEASMSESRKLLLDLPPLELHIQLTCEVSISSHIEDRITHFQLTCVQGSNLLAGLSPSPPRCPPALWLSSLPSFSNQIASLSC
eukprot:130038-Hanusia_phi.AAC.1